MLEEATAAEEDVKESWDDDDDDDVKDAWDASSDEETESGTS